ncbi:hypothetical protein EYF80_015935 [Liparis tanakae]|uniref:Uncharacterized protein n=1 Tax=Liparis tanakae TaxID=230148 RepID=A0A4Z2I7J3_9TELE|nr:hypothetical protein EYF80_015935 [Liparis tanakae]
MVGVHQSQPTQDKAIGSQIHASQSGMQPITRHLPLNTERLSLTSSRVLLTCTIGQMMTWRPAKCKPAKHRQAAAI